MRIGFYIHWRILWFDTMAIFGVALLLLLAILIQLEQ
jgi:hypothetical protein